MVQAFHKTATKSYIKSHSWQAMLAAGNQHTHRRKDLSTACEESFSVGAGNGSGPPMGIPGIPDNLPARDPRGNPREPEDPPGDPQGSSGTPQSPFQLVLIFPQDPSGGPKVHQGAHNPARWNARSDKTLSQQDPNI